MRAYRKHAIDRRWLGWLVGLPGIRQIARWGYNRFADRLFAWNKRHGRW